MKSFRFVGIAKRGKSFFRPYLMKPNMKTFTAFLMVS
jgi:hypothetical protein